MFVQLLVDVEAFFQVFNGQIVQIVPLDLLKIGEFMLVELLVEVVEAVGVVVRIEVLFHSVAL